MRLSHRSTAPFGSRKGIGPQMNNRLQTRTKAVATRAPAFIPARTGLLQRKCACGESSGPTGACAECRKGRLQRNAADQAEPSAAPPIVNDALFAPGQPLEATTRAFMEPRFGHDFSQVRVHTGAKAAESAQAVNALAYTVGRDIVFGAGRYAPGTPEGDKLIAHELTHVAQQSQGVSAAGATLRLGMPGDAYERQADLFSTAAISGSQAAAGMSVNADSGPFLRRQGNESVTEGGAGPAGGKRKGDCSVWEKNRRSFAIRIADYFYRTELGREGAMKSAPTCEGDPPDICTATYIDGTKVTVYLLEIPNSVAAESGDKWCEYTYDCPEGSGVVFKKKQCSGKQEGAEKEMAQE